MSSLSDLPDDILGLISNRLNGFDNCSLWMASDSKLKQRLVYNVITDFDIKYTVPGRYLWPGNFLKKLQRLSRLSLVVDQDVYRLPIENIELFPIETLKYFKLDSQYSHHVLTQKQSISSNDSQGPRASSKIEYINLNDFYPNLEYLEIIYQPLLQQPIWSIDFLNYLPRKLTTLLIPDLQLNQDDQTDMILASLPSTLTLLNLSFSTSAENMPELNFSVLPPNLTSLTSNARILIDSHNMIPNDLKLLHLSFGNYNLDKLSHFLPTGLEHLSIETNQMVGESITHLHHLEYLEIYSQSADTTLDMIKLPQNLKRFEGYFFGSQAFKFTSLPVGLVELQLEISSEFDREFFLMLPQTIKKLSLYSPRVSPEFFELLPKNLESFDTDLVITESLSLLPKSLTKLKFIPNRTWNIREGDQFPPKLEYLVLRGVNILDQTTLKTLPENLKSLRFQKNSIDNDGISAIIDDEVIPCLPRGLTYLYLFKTFTVSDVSAFKYPPNLKYLYLSGNDKMTDISIPHLPKSLMNLYLMDNTKLTNECIKHLPRNLVELYIPHSQSINSECCEYLPKYLSKLELPGSRGWIGERLPKYLKTPRY